MTSESYIKVNKGNDHQLKKLLIFYKFSLLAPWEMYGEQYGGYA